MQPTTIASVAVVIWRALEARGIEPHAFFKRGGVEPAQLHDANARIPLATMTKLWDAAVAATDDPCFGLFAGSVVHPTTYHALGYAWHASRSLREAIERFARYTRLVSTAVTVRIVTTPQELEIAWEPMTRGVRLSPAAGDAAAASVVAMCRSSCGEGFNPRRLRLGRERPPCHLRFDEYFRAPIEYAAADNAIVLDAVDAGRPLPTSNAELARSSEQVVVNYLAHLDRREMALPVKATLVELLPSGKVNAKKVADALFTSLRSLQRKLAEQGTGFASLLDETRRELAQQYVANSNLSVGEITYLLGFADPANFTRAFRRWTGKSPSAYRQEQ